MSTKYTLQCKSGVSEITLYIVDSLNPLPGSDTWSCADQNAFSIDKGPIASWGSESAHLQGLGVTPVATLSNFSKSTDVGGFGKGDKFDPDGTFPSGSFDWECIARN